MNLTAFEGVSSADTLTRKKVVLHSTEKAKLTETVIHRASCDGKKAYNLRPAIV